MGQGLQAMRKPRRGRVWGLGGANNQTQENVGPTHPRCLISKQARPNWGTERGTALFVQRTKKSPAQAGLEVAVP